MSTYSYLGSRRLGGIQDRLGSHRADIVWNYGLWQVGQKYSYFPYGQDRTATPNDRFKFATYFRDAVAGLDYADQRYYGSTWGRFLTPDPYQASGGAAEPQTWNRYIYVVGDPVNLYDPTGLDYVSAGQFDPRDPRNVAPGHNRYEVVAGLGGAASFYLPTSSYGGAGASKAEPYYLNYARIEGVRRN
ncbi:MAG: RHS repeat-associated core domain-containing protein [Fimbriimonadaceae bacterium]